MKIAIVGAGVSGLVCAHLLHEEHEVTVFEAAPRVGGHTHTISVDWHGDRQSVDTGFIVFNEAYYPSFTRLLRRLGVAWQATTMSLSVRSDETGLEYCGASLNALFAQRSNLVSIPFLKTLAGILRFQHHGAKILEELPGSVTVEEFVTRYGYSRDFYRNFLLPIGSALWSSPLEQFRRYPMKFVLEFLRNHGMMQILNRPDWRVISGGSYRYLEPLCRGFQDRIVVNAAVERVGRDAEGVEISVNGSHPRFDEVILACHSDQALAVLGDPLPHETEVLQAIPYQANHAVLHTDTSVLPRNRRAWGCWNYRLSADSERSASVTYNMTMLQSLRTPHTYCVSLNEPRIDPARVIDRFTYDHPAFLPGRSQVRARRSELIRRNRTSFCGAYWGYGFHEDGVRSALDVCQAFGKGLPA